ncbi:MAG TPA: oligosaccharide flippase family protein [Chloroflexia bacterium]|jgi:O-antigen/teichoic acid export membrane protein
MSQFLKNSISGYLSSATIIVIGLLLTPLLVRELGHQVYGVWVLVTSLGIYLTLLDLGIADATTRYVATARAVQDSRQVTAVVSTAFAICLAGGLLSLVLTTVLTFLVLPTLNTPQELLPAAQWLLMSLGIGSTAVLSSRVFDGALRGAQRYDLANALQIGFSVSLAGGTAIVLLLGGGLAGIAWVNLTAGLLLAVGQMVVGRLAVPDARLARRGVQGALARELVGFSGWVLVTNISSRIYTHFDAVLLAIFLPVRVITPYNLGYRVASLLGEGLYPVMKLLFPIAADLHQRQENEALRRLLVQGTKVALAISIAGGITLWFLGDALIRLWIGPNLEEATPILYFFVVFFIISNTSQPAREVLKGQGRMKMLALMAVVETVLNLGLSVVLVQFYGAPGVALGSLIPVVLVNVVLLRYTLQHQGIRLYEFIRKVIGPALVPAAGTAALLLVLGWLLPVTGWLALLASGLLAVLTFCTLYLLSPGGAAERAQLVGRLRQMRGGTKLPAEEAP